MFEATSARIWALIPIAIALVVGVVIERFVLPRVRSVVVARGWRFLGALVDAIGGNVVLVGVTVPPLSAAIERFGWQTRMEHQDAHAIELLGIFAVATICARLVGAGVHELSRLTPLPAATLFRTLGMAAVYIIASLVGLQSVGVSIVPLLGTLGVGGLAVALALRDTLANLFAGLQIIASRQVRPGDYVKIDAVEGTVADVTWRNTTVRDLAGSLAIVPNEKLAGSVVINYSLDRAALLVEVPLTVAYESDLDRVERYALEEALEAAPRTNEESPRPFVRFKRLGDAKIELAVFFTVPTFVDQFELRSAYIKRVQARFRKENISLVAFAAPAPPVILKKASGETRTLYDR